MLSNNYLRFVILVFCVLSHTIMSAQHRIQHVWIQTENNRLPSCDTIRRAGHYSICNNEYLWSTVRLTLNNNEERYDNARIRIRGNTSAYCDTPHYKLKLEHKADLIGLGYSSKEWNLMKVQGGYSLVILPIIHAFNNEIKGGWQPNYRFVELTINDSYRGLYMIVDPIKEGKNYIQTKKTGLILENDPYWWKLGTTHFRTPYQKDDYAWTFKYPKEKNLDKLYVKSVQDFMIWAEKVLYENDSPKEIWDFESFAKYLLLQDMICNWEVWGSNMYVIIPKFDTDKPRKSKIKMGPLWDPDGCFILKREWSAHHLDNTFVLNEMLKNKEFFALYKEMYDEVRPKAISIVEQTIDSLQNVYGNELDSLIALNNKLPYCKRILSMNEAKENAVAVMTEHLSFMDLSLRFPFVTRRGIKVTVVGVVSLLLITMTLWLVNRKHIKK